MTYRVRIYWTERGHTVTEELRVQALSPRHAIYEAVKSERFPRNIEDAQCLCLAATPQPCQAQNKPMKDSHSPTVTVPKR